MIRPGGESMLQFDVPELVDRARLTEDSSSVRIIEEAHK
jgi:hypothetical protein